MTDSTDRPPNELTATADECPLRSLGEQGPPVSEEDGRTEEIGIRIPITRSAPRRTPIEEGRPGDYFVAEGTEGSTFLWKLLDGADLELAHELGYEGLVAAIVADWDGLNPPHSLKTDENEPPYGMISVAKMPARLLDRAWVRSEQLRPMFELDEHDEWVRLPEDSGFYH